MRMYKFNRNNNEYSSSKAIFQGKDLYDLKGVRVSLLPSILWALTLISIPAMAADIYKLLIIRSDPILAIHLAAWVLLWLITLIHKRLGYNFSAGFLIVLSYALSFAGIYNFGLLGGATFGFFGGGIMAAIFFGARSAAVFSALSVLTLGVFGLASKYGYISYDLNYSDYIAQSGPWLATMTTYLLYIGIAIVGFMRLINAIGKSLDEQRLQTDELQKLNESLRNEIVERERAVSLHREDEEKFRVITSSALDAVIMLDDTGRVVLWNPAAEKIFGYSSEEMLGREVHSIVAPVQYHQAINKGFKTFSNSGKGDAIGKVMELSAKHRDGHEFAIEIAVSGINMQGKRWSAAIIRNIEERKRAEDERSRLQEHLQQAAKMEAVGRLAGGVAHDFNNLLTSICGNLTMILVDGGENNPYSATIKEVKKAAESAAQLTRQLLSFSRRQIVEPRLIDVNEHIMHMQKMLIRLIGEDVQLNIDLGDKSTSVKIDRSQFEQIVMNLLVNARDALSYGGRITVSTDNVLVGPEEIPHESSALPGCFVVLIVKDTGIGMSAETLNHIFEPFFTTKADGKGTGLGLATVYGAVQQAGGFLEVNSNPGEGSQFRVFLPEALSQEKLVTYEEEGSESEFLTGSETILLVEDEKMVRELALKLLTRWGYNVLQAANGDEAIKLVRDYNGEIDMLMTDVVMPGINGRQLAEKLTLCRPGLKVLFTSGYTEDVIAHSGVIEDGLYFIGKPYTPVALSKKVREVLDCKAVPE